jgi:hypothetical protein
MDTDHELEPHFGVAEEGNLLVTTSITLRENHIGHKLAFTDPSSSGQLHTEAKKTGS